MSQETTFEALGRATRPATANGPWPQRLLELLRAVLRPLKSGALQVRDIAREAAEVREMAHRLQHSEPGFASDLLAAADRHERQFGAR
jgi:hypothetical protein